MTPVTRKVRKLMLGKGPAYRTSPLAQRERHNGEAGECLASRIAPPIGKAQCDSPCNALPCYGCLGLWTSRRCRCSQPRPTLLPCRPYRIARCRSWPAPDEGRFALPISISLQFGGHLTACRFESVHLMLYYSVDNLN